MEVILEPGQRSIAGGEMLGVIDVDVHPMMLLADEQVADHLSGRWKRHIDNYGRGGFGLGGAAIGVIPGNTGIIPHRRLTHRLDAVDPNGRVGIDPIWVRDNLLDRFDMTAALLTCPHAHAAGGVGINVPVDLSHAIMAAFNDALAHTWLASDPRYHAAIGVSRDLPNAVAEIERCKTGPGGDRFVEAFMLPGGEAPLGHPRYWPIFEACVAYDMPVAIHPPGTFHSACGPANYYFELHSGFSLVVMSMISSLIFEGVFDRFPTLKFAMVECGWDWILPFSWRLDASWRLMRNEVPHLERRPSEYLRDHFWFSTQAIQEAETPEDTASVFDCFEESGFANNLMFSSDYPHWDADWPHDSVPKSFPRDRRARILGENASKLYGIPLLEGRGIPA